MKPGLCFYAGNVTEFRYDTVQGENLHPACCRRKHCRGEAGAECGAPNRNIHRGDNSAQMPRIPNIFNAPY